MRTAFFRWLKDEPRGWRAYAKLFTLMLLCDVCIASIGVFLLGEFAAGPVTNRILAVELDPWGVLWKLTVFVSGEELIYRGVCLRLAVRYCKKDSHVLLVAAIMSVIFGFSPQHSILSVATRAGIAIGGMLASLLYLKCGGWRKGELLKPLAFTITAHMMVDAPILIIFVLHNGWGMH